MSVWGRDRWRHNCDGSRLRRADRLLIRPASGRQAGTGLSARTDHWKDTDCSGHSRIESQTKSTDANLTNAPDGTTRTLTVRECQLTASAACVTVTPGPVFRVAPCRPVTPEVAGSSPVAPVENILQIGIFCCPSRRNRPPASTGHALIPQANPGPLKRCKSPCSVAGHQARVFGHPAQILQAEGQFDAEGYVLQAVGAVDR